MEYRSSEQLISWFRARALDATLELRPPYQRRPVWRLKQKCHLIESILMGLPIPEVYVHTITGADGASTYAVVDGQQRIRTILEFIGAEVQKDRERTDEFLSFSLEKLDAGSRWKNKAFADLTEEERASFFNYVISVRQLSRATDADVRDMFMRLNKFLTKLSPQELRNAIYAGPFVRLAERLAEDEYWVDNRIMTPVLIRRMGDIEFVSELVIGAMHGPQGGREEDINEYYSQYEDYEDEFPNQRDARELFERTLARVQSVLPGIKDTRWRNRTDFYSLFVALAHFLRDRKVRLPSRKRLRDALVDFAREVNLSVEDETAKVSPEAASYTEAVKRGTSERARRATRHKALIAVLSAHFSSPSTK